ncbi:MAG: ATP-binding protein [Bacilli bacterium]|nr:ATP-binding protein [Bacilli bacterium]
MYINRAIEDTILDYSKEWACITIYGARQVGKSTVIAHLFKDKFTRVSMDDLELRSRAKTNPRNFLESYPLPLCIDEIQKAPELLEEIKKIIDLHKEKWLFEGKPTELLFILTGSNQTDLRKHIGDSLAGRTAILNMPSLTHAEIAKYKNWNAFDPDIEALKQKESLKLTKYRTRKEIFEDIFKGGMPEYIAENKDRNSFFSSYLQTYLEKDVAGLIDPNNIPTFLRFMQYVALRTGCTIDYSDIASNIGMSVNTIKSWINILVTTRIVFLLEPYAKNLSNRIIKTPTLHFLDTGLCAYLGRWPNAESLENGPLCGRFYETYVITEILKSFYNKGYDPELFGEKQIYFYRDRDKKEVDFIIETQDGIYPIEIKKGVKPSDPDKNFDVLNKYGKTVFSGIVIDSREKILKINDKAYEMPIELIGL